MKQLKRLFATVALATLTTSVSVAEDPAEKTLVFDVFLDGNKIGYHRYEIDGPRNSAAVRSEAKFDVKFLFLTAFSYRHTAEESWAGGCLQEIQARTDSNGKEMNRAIRERLLIKPMSVHFSFSF